MPTPRETFKEFWTEFQIDCANLAAARRALFHGYGNEDIGADADELWERVWAFEDRHAHLPVHVRADLLSTEAYRYEDM